MEKLIVPVYLNQRLVFDLLAMLQGGISTVTAINKTENVNSQNSEQAKASFGLNAAFSSLLKIDLSGEKGSQKSKSDAKSVSEERVHTPASLFYQLRNILIEEKILVKMNDTSHPKSGDIVEFEATLNKNPIVETIDSLSEMLKIVVMFDDTPKVQPNKSGKQSQVSGYEKLRQQMDAFSTSLKVGNTIDLTANNLESGHEAVVTLETEYLNDPLMSDLADGKFHVVGKVIRSFEDKNESISLIRKTALSKMPESVREQFFGALSALGTDKGFDIPALRWNISGPAIQIIPIAIYA